MRLENEVSRHVEADAGRDDDADESRHELVLIEKVEVSRQPESQGEADAKRHGVAEDICSVLAE